MLNYNLPLTEAESEFAAEHHSVIYGYLRKAGLPEDDFYDVVVFGYLRAVRKYLARPELRKYSFSTIAYRAMSCDVHHSKEYWMRKKRRALVESLDEELHTRDLLDPVSTAYENVLSFQELSGKLTQKQRQIAALRSQGYRDHVPGQARRNQAGDGPGALEGRAVPHGNRCTCGLNTGGMSMPMGWKPWR